MHATRGVALEVFGDVGFFTDANIDSHARVFFLERGIIADLAIVRQRHRNFVTARAQFVRQRIHHIDQGAGVLQRRALRADHQDPHLSFDV